MCFLDPIPPWINCLIKVMKGMEIFLINSSSSWERSGSVVECLTRDLGAACLSLTGVTVLWSLSKVSKDAKIRSRYNQVPHPTQDTNRKVTNSQLDTTNESQEVSPFPAADHKAHINRRAQRHSKHKTEQKHKRSTKEVRPWNGQ